MKKSGNNYRDIEPFNPLDKKNLGESVADRMLSIKPGPLPPEAFLGAGIYAIYYVGDFELYKEISIRNINGKFECPIYIGKAVPAGARKGGFGLELEPGPFLYKRLVEHSKSIDQVINLDLKDFFCRYLVVDDIWIPLAESLLIEMYLPLWNKIVDGFGNHDPGAGRYNQQRSLWDMLHRGRPWAERLKMNQVTIVELQEKIKKHKYK